MGIPIGIIIMITYQDHTKRTTISDSEDKERITTLNVGGPENGRRIVDQPFNKKGFAGHITKFCSRISGSHQCR